jgi:hypothetical protein
MKKLFLAIVATLLVGFVSTQMFAQDNGQAPAPAADTTAVDNGTDAQQPAADCCKDCPECQKNGKCEKCKECKKAGTCEKCKDCKHNKKGKKCAHCKDGKK